MNTTQKTETKPVTNEKARCVCDWVTKPICLRHATYNDLLGR